MQNQSSEEKPQQKLSLEQISSLDRLDQILRQEEDQGSLRNRIEEKVFALIYRMLGATAAKFVLMSEGFSELIDRILLEYEQPIRDQILRDVSLTNEFFLPHFFIPSENTSTDKLLDEVLPNKIVKIIIDSRGLRNLIVELVLGTDQPIRNQILTEMKDRKEQRERDSSESLESSPESESISSESLAESLSTASESLAESQEELPQEMSRAILDQEEDRLGKRMEEMLLAKIYKTFGKTTAIILINSLALSNELRDMIAEMGLSRVEKLISDEMSRQMRVADEYIPQMEDTLKRKFLYETLASEMAEIIIYSRVLRTFICGMVSLLPGDIKDQIKDEWNSIQERRTREIEAKNHNAVLESLESALRIRRPEASPQFPSVLEQRQRERSRSPRRESSFVTLVGGQEEEKERASPGRER
jgi:hypothetical protein